MTQIQRKFNAFVAGQSLHLEVEGLTPPNVNDHLETINGGGMLGELDIALGLQKLEGGFKVNSRNKLIMKQIGLAPGTRKKITFRSVNKSEIDGTQEDEVISMLGRLNADQGSWASQSVSNTDLKVNSIVFYKHVMAGEVIHHIDFLNSICIVDGVDQWADVRSGLGF